MLPLASTQHTVWKVHRCDDRARATDEPSAEWHDPMSESLQLRRRQPPATVSATYDQAAPARRRLFFWNDGGAGRDRTDA